MTHNFTREFLETEAVLRMSLIRRAHLTPSTTARSSSQTVTISSGDPPLPKKKNCSLTYILLLFFLCYIFVKCVLDCHDSIMLRSKVLSLEPETCMHQSSPIPDQFGPVISYLIDPRVKSSNDLVQMTNTCVGMSKLDTFIRENSFFADIYEDYVSVSMRAICVESGGRTYLGVELDTSKPILKEEHDELKTRIMSQVYPFIRSLHVYNQAALDSN